MRKPWDGRPSRGWHRFFAQHAKEIWACDLFTVQTIWFRTLYVFFVIDHGTREIIHVRATAHPTARWLAQQMTEACDLDRDPPRCLIHDRDGCHEAEFNRRIRSLGITQIRTPVKAPKANAVAERWVRTIRAETSGPPLIAVLKGTARLQLVVALLLSAGILADRYV